MGVSDTLLPNPMCNFGSIPDWITALATTGSLAFLLDYARSARRQVEAVYRPILGVQEIGANIVLKNVGETTALNVRFENHELNVQHRPIFPKDDQIILCTKDFLMSAVRVRATYQSLTGARWETVAEWAWDGVARKQYVKATLKAL